MVFWPNSDYSWTLSHRAGGSMEEPLDLGADAANFALVPSLSSGDSGEAFTQVAYLRPLKATYQSSSTNLELTSGAALVRAVPRITHGASTKYRSTRGQARTRWTAKRRRRWPITMACALSAA